MVWPPVTRMLPAEAAPWPEASITEDAARVTPPVSPPSRMISPSWAWTEWASIMPLVLMTSRMAPSMARAETCTVPPSADMLPLLETSAAAALSVI